MRWSIIRLIWVRELRDQLRDRRTLFMVLVLPLLLYPVLGFAVLNFALGFAGMPSVVGVVGGGGDEETFPQADPVSSASVAPRMAWLSLTPLHPVVEATGLALAGHSVLDYPPLIYKGTFLSYAPVPPQEQIDLALAKSRLRVRWLAKLQPELLQDKEVDLLLVASPGFYERLEKMDTEPTGEPPALEIFHRPDDDHSKQALSRLTTLLGSWKKELVKVRLARRNLPSSFDDPFAIKEPNTSKTSSKMERIADLMVRLFPFLLVMWSLAGALYPAIDLCAGEKERGTMETLLITPAGREEIVLGKFLTIWVFSATSALLNLLSMGLSTWQFAGQLTQESIPIAALSWSVILSLPLSALFSAISLAIGAYARSSKEGQYYLMPLFLITMPLIFLTLAPGVELNPFYSLIPVTGVALLMQRLMTATSLSQIPWLYFIPVLAPIALYSWLALKWAILQFQREEVLFREAERIEPRLWLERLFREKEALPSTGQAFFCFGLLFSLHWLSLGLGSYLGDTIRDAVGMLAFVLAPALLMALLLSTRPNQALFLRWPTVKELGLAAVLAVLLLPPLAALTIAAFRSLPHLTRLLEEHQPLIHELRSLNEGMELDQNFALLLFAYALLPALCEEVAFRGFILSGLMRRFRPRAAVLLCAFLYALWHMNVFQFLPAFFLGAVLGLITIRSKSLLPAVIFHFLHNGVLLGSIHAARALGDVMPPAVSEIWPALIGLCLVSALGLLWWLYRKPYLEVERELSTREKLKVKQS